MTKDEGLVVLKDVVENEKKHQDYERVTELAELYYKLKTGDDIESLLRRIETRVTDAEFDQIKKIYRSIIPSTLNSTKMPFMKATRKQPIVRKLDYETEANDKKAELEGYISTYWGDKSLEKYFEYAFVDYNYIDPNAFLITEFEEFDPNVEKAQPYPFVASASECIMFAYKNEILEYLVIQLPIKFTDNGVERDGSKYTIYLGEDTIVFSQVAKLFNEEGTEVIELNKNYYAVYYFQPKNTKIPAIRFGYCRDEQTKGRTFVSVFHAVIGFLEKTLKIDSELDLSTAMVAFPQRFAYVSACKNKGCYQGKMLDGTVCPVCGGSGKEPFHKGTQDIVTFEIPHDITQMIDLERLLVYKNPPIELLQFQREYLEYLKKSVHAMMFNADLYTRSEVSVTATEKILETDNVNDTLYGFAQHYSTTWEFVVKDIATYTDLSEGLIVQHKFPKDFKFKGIIELMNELQMAKTANASTSTIAAIEDDINEILYSDRPDELKKMRIKNAINPFRGYSESNVRFIIGNGNTTLYNRTLWENLEAIFQELEAETVVWLYDLAEPEIRKRVQEKTIEYIVRIQTEKQMINEQYETESAAE